jgi:adenylate cyclase
MRFDSEGTLILTLTILSDGTYAQQTLTQQVFNGILYGVLFILAIYNLVLFFNLRDRTYLYYVLFFGTMLLGIMALDGFAAQYLWPNQGLFAAIAARTFLIMSFTFGLMFTISFLRTRENAPRLHKIMTALAVLIVILLGLQLIWFRETAVVHVFLMLASGISMLLAGIMVWRKGYRPARYFLVGWSVVLFGFIIFILTLIDLIPVTTLGDTMMRIGLIVLALVLSTGLAERINAYRQELEEEVTGKTRELQKEIIEHEESEARLRRVRDELATVITVSHKVTSTLNLDDLLYLILDEAKHVIPYDGAGTFLLKDLVFEFQSYRGTGPREQMMGIGFPVSGISLLYRLVNQKQSFIVDEIG